MNTKLRFVAILLCLLFVMPIASGYAGAPDPSALEPVHLVGYVPGDPSPDSDKMMAVLNEMLTRDINATIEFKYLNWGEFFDKYPLLFTTDEDFDFVYIASWNSYLEHMVKGAYLDITDLLPVYAPDIVATADPDTWKSTSYQGRVYGIPHDGRDRQTAPGTVYREDLRKKYGVPELTGIEQVGEYIAAIKENEPLMARVSKDAVNNNLLLRYAQFEKTGWSFDWYGMVYDREDPDAKLFLKYETPEYRDLIALMVDWQQKGYWDTSVMDNVDFVNQVAESPFGQGLSAFFGTGTGAFNNVLDYIRDENLDWEANMWWTKSPSGHIDKSDTLNDGVSIGVNSKNPERALMAINLLLTQRDYQWLLPYGIENEHYVIGEDGWGMLPEGVTSDNTRYYFWLHPFSWFLYDTGSFPPPRETPAYALELEMDAIANAQTLLGFQFDTSELGTEMAALNDIWVEYEIPLSWGFIQGASIEEDIANLVAKQKAAGMDKVLEEAQQQIDAFLGK